MLHFVHPGLIIERSIINVLMLLYRRPKTMTYYQIFASEAGVQGAAVP